MHGEVSLDVHGEVSLDVHGEVSLDGSLGDEGTHHTAEGLPGGEDTRGVKFVLRNSCRLFNQLTEHLRLRTRRGALMGVLILQRIL